MAFKVGDKVVYPHYGAAVVESKEKKLVGGVENEYLTLRLAHLPTEMVISVPIDNIEKVGVRWPIGKEDVEDLFDVLRKRDIREPSTWSRRYKNHQEKLKSGDIYQVAEVVRNLWRRQENKGLSPGEAKLMNKAMDVLQSELSFSLDLTPEVARDKIEEALSQSVK